MVSLAGLCTYLCGIDNAFVSLSLPGWSEGEG